MKEALLFTLWLSLWLLFLIFFLPLVQAAAHDQPCHSTISSILSLLSLPTATSCGGEKKHEAVVPPSLRGRLKPLLPPHEDELLQHDAVIAPPLKPPRTSYLRGDFPQLTSFAASNHSNSGENLPPDLSKDLVVPLLLTSMKEKDDSMDRKVNHLDEPASTKGNFWRRVWDSRHPLLRGKQQQSKKE